MGPGWIALLVEGVLALNNFSWNMLSSLGFEFNGFRFIWDLFGANTCRQEQGCTPGSRGASEGASRVAPNKFLKGIP